MREIKFRAWDKKSNRWYETELKFYGFTLFGECTLLCPPRLEDLENLKITQYTGLKDKNGKDIYEGDIVKVIYAEAEPDEDIAEESTIHKVEWQGEYPAFDLEPYMSDDSNSLMEAQNEHQIEVIGNIHENPELIKA